MLHEIALHSVASAGCDLPELGGKLFLIQLEVGRLSSACSALNDPYELLSTNLLTYWLVLIQPLSPKLNTCFQSLRVLAFRKESGSVPRSCDTKNSPVSPLRREMQQDRASLAESLSSRSSGTQPLGTSCSRQNGAIDPRSMHRCFCLLLCQEFWRHRPAAVILFQGSLTSHIHKARVPESSAGPIRMQCQAAPKERQKFHHPRVEVGIATQSF